MERLRCLILRLSNTERFGGRVELLDSNTLVLYDCLYWGSHNTEVVLSHYPETQISIKTCRQSLSGFTVYFYLPRSTRREVFWYFVIGTVLACCAYALLRPPWAVEKLVQHI